MRYKMILLLFRRWLSINDWPSKRRICFYLFLIRTCGNLSYQQFQIFDVWTLGLNTKWISRKKRLQKKGILSKSYRIIWPKKSKTRLLSKQTMSSLNSAKNNIFFGQLRKHWPVWKKWSISWIKSYYGTTSSGIYHETKQKTFVVS